MTIDQIIAAHIARIPELSHSEALDVISSAEQAGDTAELTRVLARYLSTEYLRELLITSRGGARRAIGEALAQYQRERSAVDRDLARRWAAPETIDQASHRRRQEIAIMRDFEDPEKP